MKNNAIVESVTDESGTDYRVKALIDGVVLRGEWTRLESRAIKQVSAVRAMLSAAPDAPQPASQAVMQRPDLPVNWAGMIHYPDCWDTAAYPTLHDAIHECLAWSGCSVCKPVQPAEPLTVEQIEVLWQSHVGKAWGKRLISPTVFARAIEAHYGIKPKEAQR